MNITKKGEKMKKKAIKIQPGIDKLEGKTGFYTS